MVEYGRDNDVFGPLTIYEMRELCGLIDEVLEEQA